MLIIDSQVHIWRPDSLDRRWSADALQRMESDGHYRASFSYEECVSLMDEAGIDRALLIPPSWEDGRMDYVLEACEAFPTRFSAILPVELEDGGGCFDRMAHYFPNPHVRGARLFLRGSHSRPWMVDGTGDSYWHLVSDLRVPTMVIAPDMKGYLARIAGSFPDARIVLDHMGIRAGALDGGVDRWIRETLSLADFSNVYVKLSAVPAYSSAPYPHLNLRKYVKSLVHTLGPQRCLWGTDITRLLNKGVSYPQAVTQFTQSFEFTEPELNWIMGGSALDCFEWPR